jgi:L-ectoine synthase
MGFSLSDTAVDAGAELTLQYRHHVEACYCVEGEGEIEDRTTGERQPIRRGTVYALDRHDAHVVRVTRRLRLVCVFRPPLRGAETHDASGGYAAPEDKRPG